MIFLIGCLAMANGGKAPMGQDTCRVCAARVAERTVPFYCAKANEMRPGAVPIYRFATPVCDVCVKERTARRIRNYWTIALAVIAVVGISVFIAMWIYLGKGSSGTMQGRLFVTFFLAGVASAVILLFAAIISAQVCSSNFVAIQLAIKDKKTELDAAGYTGYWTAPPKHLTVRR